MGAQWSQFFPPSPAFTEADVGSQEGKVYLVTGGASGIGLELVKTLYAKNARVYIAGRSEEKARRAIQQVQGAAPSATGTLEARVDAFKAKETKLHVLWNNAGVSKPPLGSVSKQGIELQLATNCLGPFLLTQLLLPVLEATAAAETTKGFVRVVWTSSQVMELSAPAQGIVMSELTDPPKDKTRNYVNSKTGNYFLSAELMRRHEQNGIVSVALNPGAASTSLFRHTPWLPYLAWPLMHKPKLCAYTQLFAGLSGEISSAQQGCYVVPWGRVAKNLRQDLVDATRSLEDGGSSRAREFWDFCEQKTHDYA
ncbi:hypothetical protein M406DRAFT_64654 [Cryphonectria parasitica EP155]|uniref:NAD(P)-binding protein n=1 Tax=Cryphonectria parasitica (strain ATCC 38755 / EP155) TaxID=660469 RepID=A0A9P4XUZ7_CRYP1|nr:uncharacterized protein M406DRAFT_64654 [Cryphonectria parasitica EP155]KAF3761393.1 hypothetical protein M406DRAFT_64654 [Cryphonectria parasitica EP155]